MTRNIEEPARDEVPPEQVEFYDAIPSGARGPAGRRRRPTRSAGISARSLNSPPLGYHLSMMGRYCRAAGDNPEGPTPMPTASGSIRVLSKDWGSTTVLTHHVPDASQSASGSTRSSLCAPDARISPLPMSAN